MEMGAGCLGGVGGRGGDSGEQVIQESVGFGAESLGDGQ